MKKISPKMDELSESGQNFEPQARSRSYTWHGAHHGVKEHVDDELNSGEFYAGEGGKDDVFGKEPMNLKKPATRRNAWGCMSYADLISRAIESVPDQRLTLAQIYEWMIQNIPYFRDKGESNSSAGWKNSIRHNLSLHRRFSRLQNEGTGKSSWWVVNVDAKSSKTPRRRAATMDTKVFEKKRTRVRRKVESNASMTADTTSEIQSMYGNHQQSVSDCTGGTNRSGHAYSVGGGPSQKTRISSINEIDYEDGGMMPGQPFSWNLSPRVGNLNPSLSYTTSEEFTDVFCAGNSGGLYTLTPGEEPPYRSVSDYDSGYMSNVPGTRMTTLQNLSEHFLDCSPTGGAGGGSGSVNGRSYHESPPLMLPSPPPYMNSSDVAHEFRAKGMAALSHYPNQVRSGGGVLQNGSTGATAYAEDQGMSSGGGGNYEVLHDYYRGPSNRSADSSYQRNNVIDCSPRYINCEPDIKPSTSQLNSPLSSTSVLRQMLSHSLSTQVPPIYQNSNVVEQQTNQLIKLERLDPVHDMATDDMSAINYSTGSPGVAPVNYSTDSPRLTTVNYTTDSPEVDETSASGRRMLSQDMTADSGSELEAAGYLNVHQNGACSSIELNRMVDSICGARLDDSYEFNDLVKSEAYAGGVNMGEEDLWEFNMDLFPSKCSENT